MMRSHKQVPILGFAAWSGTGKTTLLLHLLPLLTQIGIHTAVVKHAHHRFDVDHPGKDSYVLRHAGASQIIVTSRSRWALMVERPTPQEPRLVEALQKLHHQTADLILVEGFKDEPFPKIELCRPSLRYPLLFPDDPSIIAVATDAPLARQTTLPLLALNQPAAIKDFILNTIIGGKNPAPSVKKG